MSTLSVTIPSLVNGVSQQAAPQRLPSQGALQENFVSSLADGLVKRPGARHRAKLANDDWSTAAIHVINRDDDEKYLVVIAAGSLRVFTLDGAERTVAFPDGTGYLAAPDPATAFSAVTIADHTVLLNRTVTVAMGAATTPTRPAEALVNVRQGNYGRTYRISIDGVERASYQTPNGGSASHAESIDTSAIATELYNDLVAWGGAGFTITRHQNAIHIAKDAGDFSIAVEDGFNGDALKVAKDQLQRFSDLPNHGPDGFHVEIVGDRSTAFDNYYVRFEKSATEDSAGVWRETTAEGVTRGFDAATLPHLLVRESDGGFTFRRAAWADRTVGDAASAPEPSFVGRRVNAVFFFRNRLGFLADESVILSRAGDFFTFWPKTVTAQVDSDPIDVAASHTRVSILRHAAPFNTRLLLFSDQTQFVLDGGDLLTPQNASIRATTEFLTNTRATPVTSGRNVYFAVERGGWSAIREYFLEPGVDATDAAEITKHVPAYIPGGVFQIAASAGEDMLVALASAAPETLFVYAYYWSREEKLQSSWSVWRFEAGARVLAAAFVETALHLVLARSDGVYLEAIDLDLGATEEGGDPVLRLDRRIDETACAAAYALDAEGRDWTTFTLPYPETGPIEAVARMAGGGRVFGQRLAIERPDATTFRARGDLRAAKLAIGRPFAARYRFSPFYLRDVDETGARSALEEGRLQILYLTLSYDASGPFDLIVKPTARDPFTYRFSGRLLGADGGVIGARAVSSGRFRAPVFARNTEVAIELVADGFSPCSVSSADWEGRLATRVRRGR